MTGHYKDVGEEYVYERKLREQGFRICPALTVTYSNSPVCPNKFEKYAPKTERGWDWRRAIKKYLDNETEIPQKYDYKIVRAVGYWKDLYLFVYEIWIRGEK